MILQNTKSKTLHSTSLFRILIVILCLFSGNLFGQAHLDETFKGSYRAKPKTSIVRSLATDHISRAHNFKNLNDLLIFLPKDIEMRDKYEDLRMKKGDPETRKHEELFNVQVVCWVHAAKYEGGSHGDRDFHVIVGNDSDITTATFMNVEVTGLPDSSSKNFKPLYKARKQFLDLFESYNLNTNFKKIDPPLKVKIKGSLLFDGDHNHSCGTCPGPSYAKPGTVWEIHPIYSIEKIN